MPDYGKLYMTVDDGVRMLLAYACCDVIASSKILEAFFAGLFGVTQ